MPGPPDEAPARPGRAGRWLAASGLLALAALGVTLLGGSGGSSAGEMLVARADVPAGTTLGADALAAAFASRPAPDGLGGLLDAGAALGRRTIAPLAAGEPLTAAAVGGAVADASRVLRAGERAIALPLAAAGGPVAGLAPGDRVDVVATDGEGLTARARVVAGGAAVLAVDPGGDGVDGQLLLRVREPQALPLVGALNAARDVRVLRRPPGARP